MQTGVKPTFNLFLIWGRIVSNTNEAFFRINSCWNKENTDIYLKKKILLKIATVINRECSRQCNYNFTTINQELYQLIIWLVNDSNNQSTISNINHLVTQKQNVLLVEPR